MLPLKPLVNALQNALWYPNCLVRASPFFDGRLKHHHAGLVLKKPSDRFNIELPEFRHFGRRVVALGRSGRFDQRARIRERSGHGYLSPLSGSGSDVETRSQTFETGCRAGIGALLSLSGAGPGG